VQLDGYSPRIVHPYPDDSAAVVAWGNPAIVLQCGVPRPTGLTVDSSALVLLVDGINWLPVGDSKTTVFTAIDRVVYIQVTVPKSYAQPPLASISDAIAGVLPAVCQLPDDDDGSASPSASGTASSGADGAPGLLCTHRP
jgi:Protein of unknown function (DUF3515)